MKGTRLLLAIILLCPAFSARLSGQEKPAAGLTIGFYNIENLFDTIDDPAKSDEDFLPGARVSWNSVRYQEKLSHMARAVAAIGGNELPAVVGLAEVENLAVLNELVKTPPLDRGGYKAILVEGSDPRGIDVALIYREGVVRCTGYNSHPSAGSFKTRSLLYVQLTDSRKDVFHVFVNHWKSRSGGAAETEPQRLENARFLRKRIDSLQAVNPGAKIIIMGDLNDEPSNRSVEEVLGARPASGKTVSSGLYNLMYDLYRAGEGTLYYKDWDLFDQLIVTGNLLSPPRGKGPKVRDARGFILKADWLLYQNRDGVMVPNRTAGSREYFGGYSDHLPVYLVID